MQKLFFFYHAKLYLNRILKIVGSAHDHQLDIGMKIHLNWCSTFSCINHLSCWKCILWARARVCMCCDSVDFHTKPTKTKNKRQKHIITIFIFFPLCVRFFIFFYFLLFAWLCLWAHKCERIYLCRTATTFPYRSCWCIAWTNIKKQLIDDELTRAFWIWWLSESYASSL